MEADVEPETDWKYVGIGLEVGEGLISWRSFTRFVYKEDEVVAFHKVFKDSPIHA